MPPIPEEEAAKLAAELARLDISAGQLSRVLGLNEATMRHWLSGRREMPPYVAGVLSHIIEFHRQKNQYQAPTPRD